MNVFPTKKRDQRETKLHEVRHMSRPKFFYLGLPDSMSKLAFPNVCGASPFDQQWGVSLDRRRLLIFITLGLESPFNIVEGLVLCSEEAWIVWSSCCQMDYLSRVGVLILAVNMHRRENKKDRKMTLVLPTT